MTRLLPNLLGSTLWVAAVALGAALGCGGPASATPTRPTAPPASGEVRVGSLQMTVSDLDAEEAFLARLDFVAGSDAEALAGDAFSERVGLADARATRSTLQLGEERLAVIAFSAPAGRPIPEPTRSNDAWFQHLAIIVSNIDVARERLKGSGMRPVSPSPQTIPQSNPVAAGVRAYYFRDPEGHNLELLAFPEGKGDARWHDAKRVFLGIDHTGIVCGDTARSVAFYRELLGLEVKSESLNSGPEQEALSGVPGARVHITSLRGHGGLGIELLEYVAPRDGRPFPETTAADRVHWETNLEVADLDALTARLQASKTPFRSSEAPRSVLVRDPDGHALRITAR